MGDKIVGYLLLLCGVLMILFATLSVYRLITGSKDPTGFFKLPSIQVDLGPVISATLPSSFRSGTPVSAKTELIPSGSLNRILNLIAHLALMGFVASSGYKIALVGTYLLRPIEVKLKSRESQPPAQT